MIKQLTKKLNNHTMQETKGLLDKIKQHGKLAIRVNTNANNDLSAATMKMLTQPHRKANFFMVFVESGSLTHRVDLKDLTITDGQLFFVLPNQIHAAPAQPKEDLVCFKMSFDQNCLSLLPKTFSFLINPFNAPIITFDPDASERVKILFGLLNKILHSDQEQKDADIILAHLHSLLTELDKAYFKGAAQTQQESNKLSTYIAFKMAVETHLTEQYSIDTIARNLSVTTNQLYTIVKAISGLSPKEYITNRLMLEAQRRLYYSETSVKELAYDLGFSDPDYFSKLFKKHTGLSVTQFLASIQDLSGN